MRIIFPIVLILFMFIEKRNTKIDLYKISLFLYFVFLSLRFLQGTDYISYYEAFCNELPLSIVFVKGFYNTQFEFIYNALVTLFKTIGLPFQSLIMMIGFIDLYFIDKFIKKFSDNKILSLLILYLVYGIVFLESALRQSMAMTVILGLCFVGFSDKNIKKMIFGSILALMLHRSSAIISVVLFMFYYIENKYGYENIVLFFKKNYRKILVLSIALIFVTHLIPYNELFVFVPGELGSKLRTYFSINSYSTASIALRLYLVMISLILFNDKKYTLNRNNFIITSVYIFGFVFYFLVCKFSLLSRISAYFEIMEIILYSQMLNNFTLLKSFFKKILLISYCIIICILFIKDGISTQKQTKYENESVVYPYYNIFNREKALSNIKVAGIIE